MGPYCRYCNNRCFTRFPEHTPDHIIEAYEGLGNIIATCRQGQAFEQERVGWCYATIKAEIKATKTFARSGGTLSLSSTMFTLDLSRADSPHIALFQLANMLEQSTGYWLDFREESNGQVTEWMLMDSHGVAHKATGTPRTVTIPLA